MSNIGRNLLPMSTPEQIDANRRNAQHSTGPETEEGKARSSVNALKSGLTGRTVLLAGDDLAAYGNLLDQITARYKPSTDDEKLLTQKIVDTEWRLARIPELICSLEAFGCRELSAQLEQDLGEKWKDASEEVRTGLLRARVYCQYQKNLSNLSLQESRLRRQLEKDTVALKELQEIRIEKEKDHVYEAARACRKDPEVHTRAYFAENGFEFSDRLWEAALLSAEHNASPFAGKPLPLVNRIEFLGRIRAKMQEADRAQGGRLQERG